MCPLRQHIISLFSLTHSYIHACYLQQVPPVPSLNFSQHHRDMSSPLFLALSLSSVQHVSPPLSLSLACTHSRRSSTCPPLLFSPMIQHTCLLLSVSLSHQCTMCTCVCRLLHRLFLTPVTAHALASFSHSLTPMQYTSSPQSPSPQILSHTSNVPKPAPLHLPPDTTHLMCPCQRLCLTSNPTTTTYHMPLGVCL